MTTRKFKNHPSAQAYICEMENGDKALMSYYTVVATIADGWLAIHGLYSATTRKHIGWFMRELGFSYYDAKNLYKHNMMLNICTGEVKCL